MTRRRVLFAAALALGVWGAGPAVASSLQSAAPVAAPSLSVTTPEQDLAVGKWEEEFKQLRRRYWTDDKDPKARKMQNLYVQAVKGLKLLDVWRTAMGEAHYKVNADNLIHLRDRMVWVCETDKKNGGVCYLDPRNDDATSYGPGPGGATAVATNSPLPDAPSRAHALAQGNTEAEKFAHVWAALERSCEIKTVEYRERKQWGEPGNPYSMVTDNTTRQSVTEWTGGCANGRRDGVGRYATSWQLIDHEPDKIDYNASGWVKEEGTFVAGEKVGLWCFLEADSARKQATACQVVGPHYSAGSYRKQPDGRWQRVDVMTGVVVEPAVFVPAGELERVAEQAVNDARNNRTSSTKLDLVVPSLADLTKDGRLSFILNAGPIELEKKRISIVLTSRAVSEFERFTKMRQAMIDASARGSKVRAERDAFIANSEPRLMLASVAAGLQRYSGPAKAAEDLAVLKDGMADYVFVLDWRFSGNFALGAKEYKELPMCAAGADAASCYEFFRESYSAYLVNPKLEAVRSYYWDVPGLSVHLSSYTVDFKYDRLFADLASGFKGEWHIDEGFLRSKVEEWMRDASGRQ